MIKSAYTDWWVTLKKVQPLTKTLFNWRCIFTWSNTVQEVAQKRQELLKRNIPPTILLPLPEHTLQQIWLLVILFKMLLQSCCFKILTDEDFAEVWSCCCNTRKQKEQLNVVDNWNQSHLTRDAWVLLCHFNVHLYKYLSGSFLCRHLISQQKKDLKAADNWH